MVHLHIYSPGTISLPKPPPRQGWHSSESSWRRRRRRKAGTPSWLGHRATSNTGKCSRRNAPADTSEHSFSLENRTLLGRVTAVNVTAGTARCVCSAVTCGPCVRPWYTRVNSTSNTLFVQHVLQGNPGMKIKNQQNTTSVISKSTSEFLQSRNICLANLMPTISQEMNA